MGKVVRETIGSDTTAQVLDFIYDANGRPFALNYSTDGGSTFTTYYYVLNLQGDIVKLVELTRSGKVYNLTTVASYTYNAWGEILSITDANNVAITDTTHIAHVNPLRYRGYYYDTETGFYYLQSRYYDPAMHRFINADSLASTGQGIIGTNMFAYCSNNPIIHIDPTGEFALFGLCIIGGLISAAIEYGSQVYSNYSEGKSGTEAWTDVNVGKVAAAAFSGAVSTLPGGGFTRTCMNVVGSAIIEEGVNSIIDGESFSVVDVGEIAINNAVTEVISLGIDHQITSALPAMAPSLDMPLGFSEIKAEARFWFDTKGTNALEEYVNIKQWAILGFNSFTDVLTTMVDRTVQ